MCKLPLSANLLFSEQVKPIIVIDLLNTILDPQTFTVRDPLMLTFLETLKNQKDYILVLISIYNPNITRNLFGDHLHFFDEVMHGISSQELVCLGKTPQEMIFLSSNFSHQHNAEWLLRLNVPLTQSLISCFCSSTSLREQQKAAAANSASVHTSATMGQQNSHSIYPQSTTHQQDEPSRTRSCSCWSGGKSSMMPGARGRNPPPHAHSFSGVADLNRTGSAAVASCSNASSANPQGFCNHSSSFVNPPRGAGHSHFPYVRRTHMANLKDGAHSQQPTHMQHHSSENLSSIGAIAAASHYSRSMGAHTHTSNHTLAELNNFHIRSLFVQHIRDEWNKCRRRVTIEQRRRIQDLAETAEKTSPPADIQPDSYASPPSSLSSGRASIHTPRRHHYPTDSSDMTCPGSSRASRSGSTWSSSTFASKHSSNSSLSSMQVQPQSKDVEVPPFVLSIEDAFSQNYALPPVSPWLPPSNKKITLCLDLEGTLVNTVTTEKGTWLIVRPFARLLLSELLQRKDVFEIVIFSDSDSEQAARSIVSHLDTSGQLVDHVLCKPNCSIVDNRFVLKELKRLGRECVIIVDDNPISSLMNSVDAIPVPCWTREDKRDRELLSVLNLLHQIYSSSSVLSEQSEDTNEYSKQISNCNRFLSMVRSHISHYKSFMNTPEKQVIPSAC